MRDNRRTVQLLAHMPERILVGGGAGHIGSHMFKRLRQAGVNACAWALRRVTESPAT